MALLQDPLLPVVGQWLEKIRKGQEFKGKRFQKDANEGVRYFVGPYQWMYGAESRRTDRHFRQTFDDEDDAEIPAPRFQMTVNKVAELVQIFGPVLYHKNPIRQVNPREYPLPDADLVSAFGANPGTQLYLQSMMQQGTQAQAVDKTRARLIEYYLNYTPTALDLKTESRWAIDEALIKGLGLLWVEPYLPPGGGPKLIGSFYDTVDNLVVDPDGPNLRFSKWIARRRIMPVWEAERKFGLAPGSLRGQGETVNRQAEIDAHPDGQYLRQTGQTNDLIVFWEVYSKMGMGGRLQGQIDAPLADMLEPYGDYCYLAVAQGTNYPLNVPNEVWDLDPATAQQQIMQRVQWPTPFWADDGWPFADLSFHAVPNDPWPMSHLAPGMGELKFLNYMWSFMAGKIRITCRDFIAILEEAGEDVRELLLRGTDFEIIKIKGSSGKSIQDLVQFLQHPPFQTDMWRIVEAVGELFDKRVGLTELMYGMSARQDRSATESATKRDAMNIRPDDMANRVEDWMSVVARMEAFALRWHCQGSDVGVIMGPVGSALWDQLVAPASLSELLHSLQYRIESGSVRKPNRERDAQNAKDVLQTLLPFYEGMAMNAGVVAPFNQSVTLWCKSIELKPDGLLLPQPPPPQQGPPQQGPPPGNGGPPR